MLDMSKKKRWVRKTRSWILQIEGTNYDSHTVCRVCEDIIYELTSEIDDERLEGKVRENYKYLLQDIIDTDVF